MFLVCPSLSVMLRWLCTRRTGCAIAYCRSPAYNAAFGTIKGLVECLPKFERRHRTEAKGSFIVG